MPEILIRVLIPNKEHQRPCWCRECRGVPGNILVEWSARPALPPDASANAIEFCGSVLAPQQVPPAALCRAIDAAVGSALASLNTKPRRWQVGDLVKLNPKKIHRARVPDEVGVVKKLLPDGRPYVLWPSWPPNLKDDLPPYLDDDLIPAGPDTPPAPSVTR